MAIDAPARLGRVVEMSLRGIALDGWPEGARRALRGSEDMTVSLELIGPDEAADLLAKNTHNRPLNPRKVSQLAGAMSRGEWRFNGQSIAMGREFGLDLQHRLSAVIESGVAQLFLVVRDLDDSVQDTIDIGTNRSLADILALSGEPPATARVLMGALALVYPLHHYGRLSVSGDSRPYPTKQQLVDFLNEHPRLRASAEVGQSARKSPIKYPAALAAALHFEMTGRHGTLADAFWARLADGADLPQNHPVALLRDLLIADLAKRKGRLSASPRAAYTIKAWNLFVAGKTAPFLRYAPKDRGAKKPGRNAEDFPVMT